jgi:GNAT superfamily N-acetyltransferase
MTTKTYKYTLHPAIPSNAPQISSLFAQSWTSPFTRLQFGTLDTATLATSLAGPIESTISKYKSTNCRTRYIVMQATKQGATGEEEGESEVVAVAQWSLSRPQGSNPGPGDASRHQEEERERDKEDEMDDDDAFLLSLPAQANRPLVLEFRRALRALCKRITHQKPFFLLENIATHPAYRGQGLASQLIEWVFPLADGYRYPGGEGALVYLETARDNPAMRIYERLGFVEKGECKIENLERFGGVGTHVHVGFVRESGVREGKGVEK